MPLPNITSVDSLRATLSFNTSDDSVGLPPGARSEHLATFEISGAPNSNQRRPWHQLALQAVDCMPLIAVNCTRPL